MRIILKPAGLAVLLVAIGVLGSIAMIHHSNDKSGVAQASVNLSDSPRATWGGMIGGYTELKDGDFSGSFVPARFFGNASGTVKAQVNGLIADPWLDNSNWADVSVQYGLETESDGNRCQRITIGAIRSGRAQMIQYMHLTPGTSYLVRARMRASETMPAQMTCTALGGTSPGNKDLELDTQWHQYSYTIPATTTENLVGFAFTHANATVWVDDVTITPIH